MDGRRHGLEKSALVPVRQESVADKGGVFRIRVIRQRVLPTKHGHVGSEPGDRFNPRISE